MAAAPPTSTKPLFNPLNIPPRPKTPFHVPETPPIPILRSTSKWDPTLRVSRNLGEGRTSFVIAVWTPSGLREHALKIPFPQYSEKAKEEARMLQSLQDVPHIIKFEGDFTLDSACFRNVNRHLCLGCKKTDVPRHAILTEIFPCPDAEITFLASLSEGEPTQLTSTQITSMGKQLAETLQGLERKNLIHRDIKPDNICYDVRTDRFFLSDVGFTEEVDKIPPGEFRGSLSYAAPEHLLGKSIDTSSDMWSCGATLFELYTGEALAPTYEGSQYPRIVGDLCHMITQNIGPFPLTFIESMPKSHHWFEKDGSTALKTSPSKKATELMDYMAQIGLEYPNIPLWEARIRSAAKKKGETEKQATHLIEFLRPMFAYENRIPPLEVLQRLAMQDTHTRFIKDLRPHQATPLSVSQILSIGEQGLKTLHDDLHANCLIHQDLNPRNIAYDETTNKAVIYGLRHAKNTQEYTGEYSVRTLPYQSPEQLLELRCDSGVDVWGLGTILFELYTGTPLIPAVKHRDLPSTIMDFWHMIVQNIGPIPEGYLSKASADAKSYFKTDGSREIAYPPSSRAKELMNTYKDIAKEHPHIPLWQARIYAAAKKKGESKTKARRLIIFLHQMLRYAVGRTTAADELQRLAILKKAEQQDENIKAAQLQPRSRTS